MIEGDTEFLPGESRPEAEVRPESECHMTVFGTGDVEPVRFGEPCRVAVGSAEEKLQCFTGLHSAASEFAVL